MTALLARRHRRLELRTLSMVRKNSEVNLSHWQERARELCYGRRLTLGASVLCIVHRIPSRTAGAARAPSAAQPRLRTRPPSHRRKPV